MQLCIVSFFKNHCLTLSLADSVSKGVGALKILGESLDKKESIVYMYEEYNVSLMCSRNIDRKIL